MSNITSIVFKFGIDCIKNYLITGSKIFDNPFFKNQKGHNFLFRGLSSWFLNLTDIMPISIVPCLVMTGQEMGKLQQKQTLFVKFRQPRTVIFIY